MAKPSVAEPGQVTVLGVRHHGPGSARAVGAALDRLDPEVVVIEGPPELDSVATLAGSGQMKPPVAGLVYNVANPRAACFYPMASFSPEWVALRWALDHGRQVHFADLPAANSLAETARDTTQTRLPDPIAALADAAGYDDSERWWEDAIESRVAGGDVLDRFAAITAAITEFRSGVETPTGSGDGCGYQETNERREAAMRTIVRRIVKQVDGPVAVVCGAYHAPELVQQNWPSQTADRAALKGLAKTKVAATWAPWTTNRLTFASGYGAGVTAPGWYQHLFTTPNDTEVRWFVHAAGLLRADGHDASAASVLEATRLASTLAALRGRPAVGLTEVSDAITTIMCGGSPVMFETIESRLHVGESLGSVPPDTPMVPLAEDLARAQRKLRLKPSAQTKTVVLDLRNPSQLERSVLFHRLRLVGIDWAIMADAGRTSGTFKEVWDLCWQPSLALDVIEASIHGTTVESAAAAKVRSEADGAPDLGTVAELIESCLPAEISDATMALLDILAERTAVASDHLAVMNAVEPLARTRRYGNVRGVDVAVVHHVLEALIARSAIGLSASCADMDDDAAVTMRAALESVNRGVSLVDNPELKARWLDALADLSGDRVHGLVMGRAVRVLVDSARLSASDAAPLLHQALSLGASPQHGAAWLDGFLGGDVSLLLYDRDLFGLVHNWLATMDDDVFEDLMPLIRRTFSRFEKAERRLVGELASRVGDCEAGGVSPIRAPVDNIDSKRAAPAVATMARFLGVDPSVLVPELATEEIS